jgi:hypothetical protein
VFACSGVDVGHRIGGKFNLTSVIEAATATTVELKTSCLAKRQGPASDSFSTVTLAQVTTTKIRKLNAT